MLSENNQVGNAFSMELIAQAKQYALAKSPEGALIATILNILATSNTEKLIEIYEKISKL